MSLVLHILHITNVFAYNVFILIIYACAICVLLLSTVLFPMSCEIVFAYIGFCLGWSSARIDYLKLTLCLLTTEIANMTC